MSEEALTKLVALRGTFLDSLERHACINPMISAFSTIRQNFLRWFKHVDLVLPLLIKLVEYKFREVAITESYEVLLVVVESQTKHPFERHAVD